MDTATLSLEEFSALLDAELNSVRSPNRRSFIQGFLIPPYQSQLRWEYGADEPFQAWTFADLRTREVVVQYCRGGFGARGSPWGINFRTDSHFGMDSGWYPSLDALIEDWGVAE